MTAEIIAIKEKNIISLPKQLIERFNLKYKKTVHVQFGWHKKEVNIRLLVKDDNVIELSGNVIEDLNLPENINYHIKAVDHTIMIGPYIGVYLGKKKQSSQRRLNYLSSYVKKYSEVNGVIIGFTIEDLDKENLLMNGLVYNPLLKIWERKTLPYPNSIIKRGSIDQKNLEYLYNLYGNKMYNYKKINKWEVHERLEQFSEVEKHLPKSTLFKNEKNLLDFLKQHQNIYVKPIDGNQGIGIYNIVLNGNEILIYTRKKNENVKLRYAVENLDEFTTSYLKSNKYIMQETLDLKVNNKTSDFRIGMDKSIDGKWHHNMYITRVGGDESIVSNVASSGGYVQIPSAALAEIYNLSDKEISIKEKELLDLAYNVAERLDQTGIKLGKLAMDIAVTKDKKVYLIEVNNTAPNDNIMKLLDDHDTIFKIRNENAKYGKFLAGFSTEDNLIVKLNKEKEISKENRHYTLLIKVKRDFKTESEKELETIFREAGIKYNHTSKGINISYKFINNENTVKQIIESINENENLMKLNKVIEIDKKILRKKSKTKKVNHKENKVEKLKRELKEIKLENENLNDELALLKNSKSFKITAPLRKIVNKLK